MVTVEQIKSLLHLQPLSAEGGYFAEVYRSEEQIPPSALPNRYGTGRSFGTAIYYVLTLDTFSAMHRLLTDEIYHFYLGEPVEMLQLWPDGSSKLLTLGPDILNGMRPQVVVPSGVWQGSRLAPGGKFALMGTTMAPGFDPGDYEGGVREELAGRYPAAAGIVRALTRA
jgi:uncharacterized protein